MKRCQDIEGFIVHSITIRDREKDEKQVYDGEKDHDKDVITGDVHENSSNHRNEMRSKFNFM